MIHRLAMVYNAADAIDHFYEAGLQYPDFGTEVLPSALLEVIDLKRRRLFGLIGSTATGAEVCLQVRAIHENVLTVSDRYDQVIQDWQYRISDDPLPIVSDAHGDLRYFLDRLP